ncbi:MAG TPA: PIN domain-containing protein [Candidatus Limnocylindrales bacterium]|nr:PIN domain-containing protein [Candidatus Limnocylindrales bacterium]
MDPAFAAVLGIVDVVYPIERRDVERARRILLSAPDRSARDAVHIAVMHTRDIDRVMSFDRRLDGIPGIRRLE